MALARRFARRLAGSVALVFALVAAAGAQAQGTKVWTVTRYDEMERGTAEGVAIRSDGRLEQGPATSLLYTAAGNYVWSVAADSAGNVYAGLGGTTAGSAAVMKIAPDGKATKIFDSKELGVEALRIAPDGKLYAATLPDGKVYRLGAATADATVLFDPSQTAEKPHYLWDLAFSKSGELYIAAGAPAAVYRIPANSTKPELLFKTVDQHIRCLLMAPNGTLWAGTDGSGVIYRFDTHTPNARPFAAYAAPKREITSLAIDPAGNIYAAGVGNRPAATNQAAGSQPGLPPLAVTGNVGVTITFSQPGSASAAAANTLIPDGSEIYRIAPDGSPSRLAALKDDVVYALTFDDGSLLAATGNRGRVYRVEPELNTAGRFTDVAHLDAAQGMAFAAIPNGQIVATSNSGKVFRLDDKPAATSTYTSEVFDARGFADWGRLEVLPEALTTTSNTSLFVRTGNVESPLMGWSDWIPADNTGAAKAPGGRYAQWKAVLHTGGAIDSVGVNYLEKNLAPVVDDIAVQPGARVAPSPQPSTPGTVQITFASPGNSPGFVPDANTQPLSAQKDRSAITVRWAAHDDNDDDLLYAVWYRGLGERNWRLLKDKVPDKYLSFDASQLPDGRYQLRVVASDSPCHVEALTGERASSDFLIDTTPPVPGTLTASLVPSTTSASAKIHATFSAKDVSSPIAHAEYSIDAGPWQYLEPVGKVSDSLEEHYDFTTPIPAADPTTPVADTREHVLALRVYDRFDNLVTAKTVVR